MKTFLMVAIANVVIVALVALASSLWSLIGAVVGYGNSWWVAPLASVIGFVIAGRVVRDADRDVAFQAQYALFGVFCVAVLVASLLNENLGIPAWRITLTLVLCIAGTWLGRAVLRRLG